MSEHIVFMMVDDEWREVSRHGDRAAAFRALEAALADQVSGTTAKIDPGGELFMVTPDGSVIEVMQD